MNFDIKLGAEGMTTIMSTEETSAQVLGSGILEVFSTPIMIAIMENAAMKAVENQIPEDYATVGISMNVRHLAATPIGKKVWAKAKLIEVKGKKLTFQVEAYDEIDKIGEGIHERYIVPEYSFVEKCSSKYNKVLEDK